MKKHGRIAARPLARSTIAAALAATLSSGWAAEAEGPRLSGFVDEAIAYTYESPARWSRAVTRLQLNLEGALGEDVKYKLSGRLDVDPVYYASDFYLDPVKKDQRFSAFWRENYLDFNAGDWAFRVGAQNIIWAEVAGLFFADVVSARDLREFLLPSFDILRIPQWAVRTERLVLAGTRPTPADRPDGASLAARVEIFLQQPVGSDQGDSAPGSSAGRPARPAGVRRLARRLNHSDERLE